MSKAVEYRISNRDEETDCGYCGCPLYVGDSAYEAGDKAFCSPACYDDLQRQRLMPSNAA